jgi:hypothetical protein
MEGHIARRKDKRTLYIGFWWQCQKERQLERPIHQWEDNIKMLWYGLA